MKRTTSSCEDFGLLISLKLDDEISSDEQAELTAHLRSCLECRHRVANFSRLSEWVGSVGAEFMPDEIHDDPSIIVTQAPQKPHPEKLKNRKVPGQYRKWWIAVSLAAVASLATVMFNWNTQTGPAKDGEDIVGPLVALSAINSRRIQDQEMLLESFQLDLRTLKLQLYALDDSSNQQEVLGRINRLMDRIDQTSVARSDIN